LPAQFQILDSADQLAAIKRLLKNLNVDDEKYPPRELMHFINAHKEQGIRAAQAEAYDAYTSRRVELYAEYEAQCQREGRGRFRRTAAALLRAAAAQRAAAPALSGALPAHPGRRVPGYQPPAVCLAEAARRARQRPSRPPGACLFAVGDDDQSIYAFRGAEIGNMRDLQREFELPNVIRLEQNYRSHGNILDAANALIKQNRGRLGKNLWTEAGAGEPIRVFEAFPTRRGAFHRRRDRELVRDGVSRQQIALLYRSNAQSRVLEHQLFTAGRAVSRAWRPALLRPPGDQACARLPAPDRQPRRRHGLLPGGQFSRRAASARAASRLAGSGAARQFQPLQRRRRAWPARPAARSPASSG
jgi:DNA helicase-2/ATP-dependent DNA helicase PcrA